MTWKARRRPSFRCSMARSSAKRWSAREAGPGEGRDAGRAPQPRLDQPSELLSQAKLLAGVPFSAPANSTTSQNARAEDPPFGAVAARWASSS
jgi:transposase